MRANACIGGEGVKKGQKTACALYGRPLMMCHSRTHVVTFSQILWYQRKRRTIRRLTENWPFNFFVGVSKNKRRMSHDRTGYLSKTSLVFTSIIKTEDAESEKFPKRQISIVRARKKRPIVRPKIHFYLNSELAKPRVNCS